MRIARLVTVFTTATGLLFSAGCAQEKKTHKVTLEGPEKKTEIKVETTKKKHSDKD